MAWVYLITAGLTEIVWAIGLKESHGFSILLPSVITIIFLIIGFYLFSKSLVTVPIGTAYAIFTGIGAVGATIVGVMIYGEDMGIMKLLFLLLLIIGIIGLKLVDGEGEKE